MSAASFTPPPLAPIEQIAKLVSVNYPNREKIPDAVLSPLIAQLSSDSERDTARMIQTGSFRQYFPQLSGEPSVTQAFHYRYTPIFFHQHAFLEVVYVCCGACNNVFEDGILPLKEGDMLFIPPHLKHAISVFNDDTLVMNFNVHTDIARHITDLMPGSEDPYSEFIKRWSGNSPCVMFARTDAPLREEIYNFTAESARLPSGMQPLFWEANFSLMLIRVLTKLADSIQIYDVKAHSDTMDVIMRTIQAQLATITQASLSYQLGYSYEHLSRMIKSATGQSFSHLRQELRLQHAARQLRATDQSIDAIITSCGYTSRSQFHTQFKAKFGQTPSQYRGR